MDLYASLIIVLSIIGLLIIFFYVKIQKTYKEPDQEFNGHRFSNINRLFMQNAIYFLALLAFGICFFMMRIMWYKM